MLEEELIIGIKTLAMIHAGKIKETCEFCTDQEAKSCGKIGDLVVWEDETLGNLNTCPLVFISQEVYDWYDELSYYKEFVGTAPKYGDHNLRFWEAVKIYNQTYSKFAYKDHKDQETDTRVDNTESELAKMKSRFKKR